jgi:hypothetical protein
MNATNSIGWESRKPKRRSERRKMPNDCFIIGGPEYKYPICAKGTRTVDCQGLMAAHQRATLILNDPRRKSNKAIRDARRARKVSFKLAKKNGCAWTESALGRKKRTSSSSRFG